MWKFKLQIHIQKFPILKPEHKTLIFVVMRGAETSIKVTVLPFAYEKRIFFFQQTGRS